MSTSYNTRLQMKTDTEANWKKAVNFIPLKGEICFYSDLLMMKIGDGETLIGDLSFVETPPLCEILDPYTFIYNEESSYETVTDPIDGITYVKFYDYPLSPKEFSFGEVGFPRLTINGSTEITFGLNRESFLDWRIEKYSTSISAASSMIGEDIAGLQQSFYFLRVIDKEVEYHGATFSYGLYAPAEQYFELTILPIRGLSLESFLPPITKKSFDTYFYRLTDECPSAEDVEKLQRYLEDGKEVIVEYVPALQLLQSSSKLGIQINIANGRVGVSFSLKIIRQSLQILDQYGLVSDSSETETKSSYIFSGVNNHAFITISWVDGVEKPNVIVKNFDEISVPFYIRLQSNVLLMSEIETESTTYYSSASVAEIKKQAGFFDIKITGYPNFQYIQTEDETKVFFLDFSTGEQIILEDQVDEFENVNTLVTFFQKYSIIPPATVENEGALLQIVNGVPAWTSVPRAEEASF